MILFILYILLFCGRMFVAYCSSSSFGLSSSLVANSLADELANGADSDQIGTVLGVAQAGWIWLASGFILWESQTEQSNAHRIRSPGQS